MQKRKMMINGLVKSMINKAADPEPREWPPKCTAFLYQPKRPSHNQSVKKSQVK